MARRIAHAELFDGCGLRLFILADYVLVNGLVHNPHDLGFSGWCKGGEVLSRVAVEDELGFC